MAALDTKQFVMPVEYSDGIFKKAQGISTLAQLSGQRPQKFGASNVMVLTGAPKAELVAEGAEKSETPTTYSNITVAPYKVQVTMRMSNETNWADEDYQLGICQDMQENAGIALGRALDLIGIHKLNPLTGAVASTVTSGITDTTASATVASGKFADAIESAEGLVISAGYNPTGLAMDPLMRHGLKIQKDADGKRLFTMDELNNFDGMTIAVSDTVSAKNETVDTMVRGIVGQFDAFRWGVQRDIQCHVIEYGDPDGLGDLQRKNQIAVRAEIVYGIGIADLNAFAKIVEVGV